MTKKFLYQFWPAIIIAFVVFAFHIRLFLPQLSFYVTPDYGRSDAISLSLANKFYYAQELKQNRIPIWNPHIGTGYPTLAEGQTAIFFIPNLILFRLLPFAWAYNLTLVLSFVLAGWGIYLFSRSLGLSKYASVFAGTVFPLGGFFVFHVQHHNLLQAASLLPWLFWQIEEFLKTKKYKNLLYFSLILFQQFTAGFPQITFYSLVATTLYLGLKHFFAKEQSIKSYVLITLAIILGVLIAAIQIGPSYELLQNSSRSVSPSQILSDFPYWPVNLLQFTDPFALGSPKNSTYPHWLPGKWGIFWESQAYIGIIPIALALAILAIATKIKNQKVKSNVYIFGVIAIFALIISLGKISPSHIIFSIPPFSNFRVPSRFLLLTQFSLVILAGLFVSKVKNQLLVTLIISLSVSNLIIRIGTYNPVEKSSEVLKQPQTAIFLKAQDTSNVIAIGNDANWNKIFRVKGWESNLEYYKEARNSLDQNSNLLYGVNNAFAYESITTKRYSTLNSILRTGVSFQNDNINLTTTAKKVINMYNVSHIISSEDIRDKDFNVVFETNSKDLRYKIFKNKKETKKYFIAGNFIHAKTVTQMGENLKDENIDPEKDVILEEDPKQYLGQNPSYSIKQLKETPNYTRLEINSSETALLVINQSYYPGWMARIDKQKTKILPANINSIAVVIPSGNHIIEIFYSSRVFYFSALISIISLTIAVFTILKIKNKTVDI